MFSSWITTSLSPEEIETFLYPQALAWPGPAPPPISCKSTKRYSVVQIGVGPDSLEEGGRGEEWVEKKLLNACPQQAHRFKKTLL